MCRELVRLASIALVFGMLLSTATEAADPDLVGYWKFDETSGITAQDATDNGNDGTLNGDPQWVAGRLGGALEFDGDGDYVDIGNDPIFNVTGQITVACWIKVTQFTVGWQAIFTMGDDSWRLQRQTTSDNLCWACTGVDGTPGNWWLHGDANVNDGEWHHAVGVYDGSKYYLYVDGNLDVSKDTSGTMSTSSYPVYIGANAQQGGREFNGLIDDVRVYKRALTDVEILGVMSGGGAVYPLASGPDPADGALHEGTWATMRWRGGDFAVSHDVYLSDNFEDFSNGAEAAFQTNQTDTMLILGFAGYPYPDGLVPGTTYYWRIDEVNDADPNSPWIGDVWSFSIPPKTAYNPDPADGAEFVDPNATFTWTPGFGAKLHTVYMGTNRDDVNNAAGGLLLGSAGYSPPALESEKVYYWRVDESDPPVTHKGDIWSFTTPGAVGNPQPANGAADVQIIETLSWAAADNATSHELYFGTDADAVRNATTASPDYMGPRALGAESYDPGGLAWDSSYAWRVDEVYPTETIKGLVWSFTTADFILVDDFESYNDIDPPDPTSNRIFDKWIDGFGTTTNGALVGNDFPPYTEQSIVHGGAQSMPYFYDNNLKTSEATLTLVYPRDWTEEGVTRLILWYRAAPANAAERMFVALNDNAVVYHDDPSATQVGKWTAWIVELQAFADQGVNLANVNTITIGFGTKNAPAAGGSGQMYFDDIRLYRPAE